MFNRYYSDDNADMFIALKEGTRTIMVDISYYADDDYKSKMVEYCINNNKRS
jgi:hypothetical protein